jgi:glycosyltransferase involved in cell wall biosynthesis
MKITIIVPCYNAAATISTQLEALANQQGTRPWEVIVADNGSTDQSIRVAKSYQDRLPRFRVVDASQRRGVAHVRNVGVSAATGEAMIFCDADDEVAPTFLAAMESALAEHDLVACRFEGAKLNHSWIARGRARFVAQQTGLQRGHLHPSLAYAGGGGLGAKKSVHESIGGFDESLLRQADSDYCIRAQLAGVELHFAADAVYHLRWRTDVWGTFQQARLWSQYGVYLRQRYLLEAQKEPVSSLSFSLTKHLIWKLVRIRNLEGLAEWIWLTGWSTGLIEGAIRHRPPSA